MYCIDTDKMPAIPKDGALLQHFAGVYVKDVQALAPLIVGIRAESGNGELTCQMNGGNITKRSKQVQYPDESRRSA